MVSSVYIHARDSNLFYNEFKDKRFADHTGLMFYHLNISNVQDSDSAIYYCGTISGVVTEFDNGTFLVLKGILFLIKDSKQLFFCVLNFITLSVNFYISESSLRYLLQQPESDSVKPGGSVTLNCTVHTGTNDTEQSVYWFKKEKSTNSKHVGTMYIHTNGSSQCVQSLGSEFPAWSCVHSLSKQNVSLSDAGTYYCAVALCGEIIFGKGTRLEVGGERHLKKIINQSHFFLHF